MTAFHRRWFSFSLRSMLAVLTLAGVWIGYQLHWIRARHDAAATPCVHTFGRRLAPVSLRLFGEMGVSAILFYCEEIQHPNSAELPEIRRLKSLFPESSVVLVEPIKSLPVSAP
jgi:hypothetical protein